MNSKVAPPSPSFTRGRHSVDGAGDRTKATGTREAQIGSRDYLRHLQVASKCLILFGRDGRIRTRDPLNPMEENGLERPPKTAGATSRPRAPQGAEVHYFSYSNDSSRRHSSEMSGDRRQPMGLPNVDRVVDRKTRRRSIRLMTEIPPAARLAHDSWIRLPHRA